MVGTIAKGVVVTLVAASLNLTYVARAQVPPVADGFYCGFASEYDPTIEGGQVQTGVINGGPMVATAPGASITLTCTIQVGGANSTHAGDDSVSRSGSGTQVATVAPDRISYVSPPGQPVYMCNQVTINGTDYYLDDVNFTWAEENPNVPCGEAIYQETYPHGGTCVAVVHVGCWYETPNGSAWCVVWVGGACTSGGDVGTVNEEVVEEAVDEAATTVTDALTLDQIEGRRCSFASMTDPSAPGQVQTGEVRGGPIVSSGASLVLACTIQVGPDSSTHAGADAASAEASGSGTVTLHPTPLTYSWTAGDAIRLCSQVTLNGTPYYWNAAANTWSVNSGVPCDVATKQQVAPVPLGRAVGDLASGGTWVVCSGSDDTTVCV